MQIVNRSDWTVPLVEAFLNLRGYWNLAGLSCRPVPKIPSVNYNLQ